MSENIDSSVVEKGDVTVKPVNGFFDKHSFIRFPHQLYTDDPNFRAPPDLMEWQLLGESSNPWFEHGEAQLFLAYQEGDVVGRISAQIDEQHLDVHDDQAGFFGFFEAIESPDVVSGLLEAASSWCRKRGMERIRGPFNFSINGESGLLVEGFDSPNYVMMPHGRPYYDDYIKDVGFQKAKDLYAWRYDRDQDIEYAREISEEARKLDDVELRDVDMNNLERDVGIIMDIFNDAWSDNWGWIPLTDAEISHLASQFKMILDPELSMIAEVEGEPAAMMVAIPNVNEAFEGLKGRLLPFGWFKILNRLKFNTPNTFRTILLGIREEYRGSKYGALSILLYTTIYDRAYEKGYQEAEASWTLEDNKPINQGMEMMGAEHYKTYRIYERQL